MHSCIPKHLDPTRNGSTIPIQSLRISETFDFRSTRDIQLNIEVSHSATAGERFRINVYDNLPTIGQKIASGMTAANQSLKLEFRIPAPLTDLYIEKISASGASEVRKVKAAEFVSADFKTTTPGVALRVQAGSGLDCMTGVTRSFTNYRSNITVNAGEVVSLRGTYSGSITMNGGTLRICATSANITGLSSSKNADCSVYFLEGSTVNVSALNFNNPSAVIHNYSDALTFTGNISTGGSFENYGKMTVNGDFIINNNSTNTYLNNGELTVKLSLTNNRHLINNNSILVEGNYNVGGNSINENNCKLVINGDFNPSNVFNNNSYIKVAKTTWLSGKANLMCNNGAMLSTTNLNYEGTITGTGSVRSIIKVTGTSTIASPATMVGAVAYCDMNGIESNKSSIGSSHFTCNSSNYLPTSSCNPEGFGTAPAVSVVADTDKDGVPDAQDDYPTDPTRAYNTYYPSATGWATYGFEDLWPAQGDYDFNDLVINSRITRVYNAANKLVEIKNNIIIRAIGASYENGFGFQLDGVSSSEVASVTGYSHTKGYVQLAPNKTEAGQPKAVIIAYDTPEPLIKRTSGSMFNTVKENPQGTPGQLELVVRFTTPLDPAKVSQEKINPFIIVDGQREVEVHLANYAPTAKANTSLFGTSKDNSNPSTSRYYRTVGNLPWAIELPVEFNYPAEATPITDAYLYFSEWAQSSGSIRADWYENKPGYRNSIKIYK
ncbi:LruC domain-containing protein [Telluribacter sp. SYSU D00476]|uniref:LruC domain-containing protein n=1 Tax=Telluribacter sp. SYSU D00476 TaxID=2811430 RepID=UPI001FF53216|nr:LruC domain-containing protein [Telluribacter sp. SYSU D00476]